MINIKYKNSVFTSLFSDPDLLRELYSAIEGVSLPPDIPVSINTLENVLHMNLYNDISFEIGGKLVVLLEHQSTINPNMTLRLLLYIAEVYERMIKGKTIYSEKSIKIPWPEFYVLYNGTKPFPDNEVLKLSDLFEKPLDLGLPGKSRPLLELEVKVININEGRNEGIVRRCKKLSEYSSFIGKVRFYWEELGNLEAAIKEAIQYCHKHGVLKEYLEIHGSEVLSMLYTEWNMEDALAVRYEEGREEGHEEGREEGREEERAEFLDMLNQGLSIEEIKQRLLDN
jgi:predicted transposase/invertase (TIGR01784 family)